MPDIYYIMRTFKFQLYPSQKQQSLLWKHSCELNSLYNLFLQDRIDNYQQNLIRKQNKQKLVNISGFDQINKIPLLKQQNPKLLEIHSQVIQQVPERLNEAYKAFFKIVKAGQAKGLPKFRSRKRFYNITYTQSGYKLNNKTFYTSIYGSMKFHKYQEITGKPKQVSIIKEKNKWFLNIVTDLEPQAPDPTDKAGIDLGLIKLVVTSDNLTIKNKTHAKYFDKKIDKCKSELSKFKKNTRRSRKHKERLQKLYDVKINKIKDFQHKASKRLARKYDTIFIEKLSLKQMSESNNTSLNRNIRNANLSQFIGFLKYKVNNVIEVNPAYTSKVCNNCKYIHRDLKLSDRTISCKCGITYDRDENASKNINCLGQAMLDRAYAELLHPIYVRELKEKLTKLLKTMSIFSIFGLS